MQSDHHPMSDKERGVGEGWEVRSNHQTTPLEYRIERGVGLHLEQAAVCWDYDLACIIEATLNFRDGLNGLNVTTCESGASPPSEEGP